MSGNSLEALCRDFEEDSLLEPDSDGSSNGDIHDETLLDAPSPEEGEKLTDGTKDETLKDESDLDGTANTSGKLGVKCQINSLNIMKNSAVFL